MSFQILGAAPFERSLNPGDMVWINSTEAGVIRRTYQKVADKIDVSKLILFECDGRRGIDFEVIKHHGLKN